MPAPSAAALLPALTLVAVLLATAAAPSVASTTGKTGLQKTLTRLKLDRGRYKKDLETLVAFPTVSALPEHQEDIDKAAYWLAKRLGAAGLEVRWGAGGATALAGMTAAPREPPGPLGWGSTWREDRLKPES